MGDVGSYSLCSRLQASKLFPSPEFRTILLAASVVKDTRFGVEFPNKVINVFDIVFGGLISEDSVPGYHAVSSAKLRRS